MTFPALNISLVLYHQGNTFNLSYNCLILKNQSCIYIVLLWLFSHRTDRSTIIISTSFLKLPIWLIFFKCSFICVGLHVLAEVCLWRSEDTLEEFIFSYCVGSGGQAQAWWPAPLSSISLVPICFHAFRVALKSHSCYFTYSMKNPKTKNKIIASTFLFSMLISCLIGSA